MITITENAVTSMETRIISIIIPLLFGVVPFGCVLPVCRHFEATAKDLVVGSGLVGLCLAYDRNLAYLMMMTRLPLHRWLPLAMLGAAAEVTAMPPHETATIPHCHLIRAPPPLPVKGAWLFSLNVSRGAESSGADV